MSHETCDPLCDHPNQHPQFAAVAEQFHQVADPVAVAFTAAGWQQVRVDCGIDCEVPEPPDYVDVVGLCPAGPLGQLAARARVVRGRPASATDVAGVLGAAMQGDVLAVLVADHVEDGAARQYLAVGGLRARLLHRTAAQLGVTLPQEPREVAADAGGSV